MKHKPKDGRYVRTAVIVICLAVHFWIIASILTRSRPVIWPWHNDTIHRLGAGADFYSVYHAGMNVKRGVSPYQNDNDFVTPYYYPFRYLPVVAIGAQLLTVLPPRTAYIIWIIVLEVLLGTFILALRRRLESPSLKIMLTGILLLSSPYFLEIYMGKFTFASATLCALALMLYGGVVLYSLSVLLKIFPLVALPALVKDYRYLPQALTAAAVLLLTSLFYFLLHPTDFGIFFSSNFLNPAGLDSGNFSLLRLIDLLGWDLRLAFVPRYWNLLSAAFGLIVLSAATLIVLFSKSKSVILGACCLLLANFVIYPKCGNTI